MLSWRISFLILFSQTRMIILSMSLLNSRDFSTTWSLTHSNVAGLIIIDQCQLTLHLSNMSSAKQLLKSTLHSKLQILVFLEHRIFLSISDSTQTSSSEQFLWLLSGILLSLYSGMKKNLPLKNSYSKECQKWKFGRSKMNVFVFDHSLDYCQKIILSTIL